MKGSLSCHVTIRRGCHYNNVTRDSVDEVSLWQALQFKVCEKCLSVCLHRRLLNDAFWTAYNNWNLTKTQTNGTGYECENLGSIPRQRHLCFSSWSDRTCASSSVLFSR
jgi:hypothetical protein